ncbi:MAG: hypothetical protein CSA84_03355 [Actinomycetales bacterium]|nr:MAG: hypothetical protein CSA84_03355 [Actinomycetales bacterium]
MSGLPPPALRMDHVTRTFGDRCAIDDLSLGVDRGQIVCLLGHNGAGKTTTVRIAGTLLTPDSGRVAVDGVDAVASPRSARATTGLVLGGDSGFYTRPSAFANLMFYADVGGVPSRQRRQRVTEALGTVGLDDRAGDPVGEFSRGMLQRLHLARALITDPRLLILDEPSTGLDVHAARDLRALVRSRANQGVGILLTTHAMGEAEALGDRIDVIRRGRLVVSGGVSDVARAAGVTYVTTVLSGGSALPEAAMPSGQAALPRRAEVPGHPDLLSAYERIDGVARVDVMPMHGRTVYTLMWDSIPRLDVVAEVSGAGSDIITREPTLEESYLVLEGESR